MIVSHAEHYTGFQFNLSCSSQIDNAVDTDVTVPTTWLKGMPKIRNDSRITVFPAFKENSVFTSIVQFSPLRVRDSGSYSCSSTVNPAPDHPKSQYLFKSDEVSLKKTNPYTISPCKLSIEQTFCPWLLRLLYKLHSPPSFPLHNMLYY